jgi:hypothetical protein
MTEKMVFEQRLEGSGGAAQVATGDKHSGREYQMQRP